MKKSKKFITAVLTVLLVLTTNVFTFAASDSELAAILNAFGIEDTGLIVEHLQSITLSESEMDQIGKNMEAIDSKMAEVEDAAEFPRETFIEIGNYALQIVHILQMDVNFINKDGNPIGLSDVILQDGSYIDGLQVVITDSEGNFLATLDPKAIPLNDLYPAKEETPVVVEDPKETPEVVENAKKATQIIKDIQETDSEEFQPENGGRLPDTAAPYGNYIIFGASLMAFSALGLIAVRKKQAA